LKIKQDKKIKIYTDSKYVKDGIEKWINNWKLNNWKNAQVIVINKEANKTLTDLVQTIIHEYVHYRFHSMAEYRVLSKYLSHARNPLEIDARKIEKRDYKKCMKYLKKEYNIG
jgi:hypothetical protein